MALGELPLRHHVPVRLEHLDYVVPEPGQGGDLAPALARPRDRVADRHGSDVERPRHVARARPRPGRSVVAQSQQGRHQIGVAPRLLGSTGGQKLTTQLVHARVRRLVGKLRVVSGGRGLRRPGRPGESLGQPPGQVRQLSSRPTADAAHPVHLNQREPQQVVYGADVDSFDRTQATRAEVQRTEQGIETRLLDRDEMRCRVCVVRVGLRPRRREEELAPGAEHLLGVVETRAVVAPQRLLEERGHLLAHRRLEHIGVDRRFAVEDGRLALPVAPPRQRSRRHLVQRHGCREPFRVGVPARRLARLQERVEVMARAGQDVLGRRAREREVEQDEMELVADLRRAQVFRLDVAMRNALLLEPVDRREEVLTEPLEQLQMEAALLAQAVGERGVARPGHEQTHTVVARAVLERQDLMELHDVLMAQGAEHVRLRAEAIVVLRRQRHLEHVFLTVALDEQRERRRPLAEPPLHDEAVIELVARACIERVGPGTFLRPGELVFEPFELFQELADRFEARRHLGMGRVLHEKLQPVPGAVEHGRDPETLFIPQPFGQLEEARRRRATREEVVRDGAEREDVELFPRRAALGHRLGRHVDPGRLFHERVQTARSRGGRSGRAGVERLPRAGLPVEDPDPRLRRLRVDHQDALRRQRAVDQVLRMGVAEGLGELPEQVETRIDVELGGPFGEPVVEALGAVAVLEDERRAENVLGVPLGRENALMPNVAQDLVLAPGRALQRRPLVVRGRLGDGIDPDPCPFAVDRRVARRPVLVVGAFEQQLVEPVVAHAPGALRRANAGFLHGAADRLGHRPVGLRADRRAYAVPGERRDDPGPLVAPGAGVAEMHPVAQVLARDGSRHPRATERRAPPGKGWTASSAAPAVGAGARSASSPCGSPAAAGCPPCEHDRRRATSMSPGRPPRFRAGS